MFEVTDPIKAQARARVPPSAAHTCGSSHGFRPEPPLTRPRRICVIGLGAARLLRIIKALMFSQKKHYLITAAFLDVDRFSSFLSSFEEAKLSL